MGGGAIGLDSHHLQRNEATEVGDDRSTISILGKDEKLTGCTVKSIDEGSN